MASSTDLAVRGESVQRVYDYFLAERFMVNRRYQRKLVWSLEEKQAFIDSLRHALPVPLILVAESGSNDSSRLEIIDGMQRLNSVVSFIENEFPVDGGYFDLDALAETKLRRDNGELNQREPILDRRSSVDVASYTLPLSVYTSDNDKQIDEVFRRINSNGRHLSRQELRQAGVTSVLSDLVRLIAARIRGDVSAKDELPLNRMAAISITSPELPYGINVDDVFWVKQRILTREQVRESRDEEIVAELVAGMILDPLPPSGTRYMDEFYGLKSSTQASRSDQIEKAILSRTQEVVETQFLRVFDELRKVLEVAGKPFNRLVLDDPPPRVPRYLQVIFLALHQLLVHEGKKITDYPAVASGVDGIGDRIVNVGGGGGNWSGDKKRENIDAVVGVIRGKFVDADPTVDPALDSWVTQFENILTQSFTEQSLYDFKQGVLRLDGRHQFDEEAFGKVLRTITAIANAGPKSMGYVVFGVCDKPSDAERIMSLYQVQATRFREFSVTGLEHEALVLEKSLDDYYHWFTEKLASSDLAPSLRQAVVTRSRLLRYFDRAVIVLLVPSGSEPVSYRNSFFERRGSQTHEVKGPDLVGLFNRFR